jgi:outer membrane lipoprotein-sorting protein
VELSFVLEMQRPHKTRLEIEFAGQTAVQVFDGTNGWKLRPFLGRKEVESFTPEEMKIAAQQQDMEGVLIDYAAKGTKLVLDKMDQVEGKDAYKLTLTMKDGEVKHVWVDAKTFLDVKMDGVRKLNGKLRTVTTHFRNYKAVEGLQMPYLVETSIDGIRGSEKINIERITLNTKLNPARFAKPE